MTRDKDAPLLENVGLFRPSSYAVVTAFFEFFYEERVEGKDPLCQVGMRFLEFTLPEPA